VMCAATGDTVNPVADQCEALGTPCLSTDVTMEVFLFGRGGAPDKPFKWTYNLFWGMTEEAMTEDDMFNKVTTNKIIGALWPNNAPGNASPRPTPRRACPPGASAALQWRPPSSVEPSFN
jgi:branched-chain amino acid transport system substrate-binding protein